MKGQLDIFLHNVKTGADEHYHQTNMVTNAVKEFINMSILKSNIYPIATTALGKLLIFDDTITENVSNFMFPSDPHLVGYANRDTNTSVAFRGSINSLESGVTSTGYKTTWDFTTSQLNTTIGSIALSNINADVVAHGMKDSSAYRAIASSSYRPVHMDSNGYLYTMGMSANASTCVVTVTFYKSNSPVTSRIEKILVGLNPVSSYDIGFTQIASYTISESVGSGCYNLACRSNQAGVHGDYLYLAWATSGTTNNLHYVKFKVSDGSFDMDSSVTAVTISGASFNNSSYSCVVGDKIFVRGSTATKIYIIDIDNMAEVTEVTLPYSTYHGEPMNYSYATTLNECLVVKLVSGSTYYLALIYPDGTTFVDTTLTSSGGHGWPNSDNYGQYKVSGHLTYLGGYNGNGWSDSSTINAYPVGQYLGTICNLSSPVTKTSAQTMKIVYTLTDA